MSKDFAQLANDVMTGVGALRHGAPDAMKAFGALSTAATAAHAIDTKTKELMALAIGIAVHCDGCVAFHTKMAHQHGASREEVMETIALAIYMGGRPGCGLRGGCAACLRAVQRRQPQSMIGYEKSHQRAIAGVGGVDRGSRPAPLTGEQPIPTG
jgi:AhpD family alkylhydroperoxidase